MRPRLKKDYHQKGLRNPFFPKQKGYAQRRTKNLVIVGALLLLAIVVLSAKFFLIDSIEVNGVDQATSSVVKEVVAKQQQTRRFLFFSQSSLIFFDRSGLGHSLESQYPLYLVSVKRKLPNKLFITFVEREIAVVWVTAKQQFYLNAAGEIIGEVNENTVLQTSGANGTELVRTGFSALPYPRVVEANDAQFSVGENIVDPGLISFVMGVDQSIRREASINIDHYEFNSIGTTQLTASTAEGWDIYFDYNKPLEAQLSRLFLILNQRVDNREALQYIDLRYGDKIFYK